MGELDLLNRDPNDLNSHVRTQFEDIFGEPEGTHSLDCTWQNSYNCFYCAKSCCYQFMSALCGICIAIYFGCDFAMVTLQHVWCYTPCMRSFTICIAASQKIWGAIIQCIFNPCCESFGMCLSNINITKG